MPGSTFDSPAAMAANHPPKQAPPPVAPRAGRPGAPPIAGPPAEEYVHARSGSMDSLESSGSSGGSSCSGGRQEAVPEYVPARVPYKAPKVPSNALQFVKVQSPLYRKAEQQINITKEVKIIREALKEGEEEWQSNLDNWKSRRRKVSEKVIQRAEEMRQIEVEEQIRQDQILQQQRKIKKFSEIVEKRSTKRNYNFDLYVGQGDDSGLGGTPEPEDQDVASDGHNSAVRSDTSEGMTSEAESVDSDIHRSDKLGDKEPPKVPRKPHPWTSKRSIINDILQGEDTTSDESLHHNLTDKDLSLCDNLSSTEPSDIEGHACDTETVSSEEDISYSGQVGNLDSGLESLSDFIRPSDIGDSASDFSQDSSIGLEKISHEGLPDFCINHELEDSDDKKVEHLKDIDDKDSEGLKLNYKIAVKPGDNRGFGFTLKGGKDQGCSAYVESVMKGGAADISGLKIGDQILMLNGESSSGCSHASLVFSVKQAVYTGLLDVVISRSSKQENSFKEENPKPMKKGSSFAEKLALFSNGSTPPSLNSQKKSPNSTPSQKTVNSEASKAESLVLRRRSTFENGTVDNGDFKNRRSSYISQNSSNVAPINGEKRHSADLSSSHYQLPENGTSRKGRPPPVPVKPKLKLKPFQSEEVPEVSSKRERVKLTKQKTFDLDAIENKTIEKVIHVYESNEQMINALATSPVSDDVFVHEQSFDEVSDLTENKIINSLNNVSPDKQLLSENIDTSDSKILDIPNSELFLSSVNEELNCHSSKFEVSYSDETTTILDSQPKPISINSESYQHHSNIYDTYSENNDYQSDKTSNFEYEEPNVNCQENFPDFCENETIPSQHDDSDEIDIQSIDIISSSSDCYNIVCDDQPNTNASQTSPDSNSYSYIDSNTIGTEDDIAVSTEIFEVSTDDLQFSTDNLQINTDDLTISDELLTRTEEQMAHDISEDIDNVFVSPTHAFCESSFENECADDLEELYRSELMDAQDSIKINISPLCLPLEKIDEDDVISASTATSSDSPNTETVIETMPSNISPLPNDELNGETYLPNTQETNPDVDPQLQTSTLSNEEAPLYTSSVPFDGEEEYTYSYEDRFEDQQDEYSREFDESLDQITSLDVIDEMEQRLMQQLEQQGDASFDDVPEDLAAQLGEVVDRQWLYLTEEAALLDDLAPRNLEPPREPPPPPPPPDIEVQEKNVLPFARANSTKRIKKELWRRRSDFLGLESSEGIDVDNIPPPPPGLEEILKQEIEQNEWLEKRLSLAEVEYSLPIDVTESVSLSSANTYSEYSPEYFLEDSELNCDDAQNEDYIENLDEQIPYDDPSFNLSYDIPIEVTSNAMENSKPSESPQHKAKQHIHSLGAAPKAKIMDSNKWITQSEKKFAAMNQKAVEPVFSHGSYNQNYWLAQDSEHRRQQRVESPAARRFSMPPTCSNTHPDVTVRTWGDREYEFQQQRPRSEFWNKKTVSEDQCSPYVNLKQDVLRTRSLDSHPETYNSSDTLESEVHKCSCCAKGLCEGTAMGIEALQLYFHIECFRCCFCHIPLGNGSCGRDVQVKNNQLYCPSCFKVD